MGMAETAVETRAEATGRRARSRRLLLLAVVAVALIGGVWKLWELRRYRRAMVEIKQEIRAGRHGHAARKAAMLLAWKPDSDEANYLLGVCEKARGQAQAAYRAWERVALGSPFGARAIQGRMELLVERGRLADAETLIKQAMADPQSEESRLGLFLGLVYSLQGRVEERARVIEACWDRLNEAGDGASELAILLVRLHIQTPTIEEVRAYLGQVGRSAPDDDRGWLGKARLAIRDGSYDQAARWLDACLRKRPTDVPVWRARLDWALATRQLADVRQARAASAGRGLDSRPGPQAHRLARRVPRRSRRGAAGAGTPGRGRFGRSRRSRSPDGDRRERREAGSRRQVPSQEDRDRPAPGALRDALCTTRRCATPGRWPAWRCDSAGRSRRRSSRPSRSPRSRSTATRSVDRGGTSRRAIPGKAPWPTCWPTNSLPRTSQGPADARGGPIIAGSRTSSPPRVWAGRGAWDRVCESSGR